MTICKNNTRIQFDDQAILIKLHSTIIAKYDKKSGVMFLNTGGWNTPTTMRRMNQVLKEYGFSQRVCKSDFTQTNLMVIENKS